MKMHKDLASVTPPARERLELHSPEAQQQPSHVIPPHTPANSVQPAFCTPANPACSLTPPDNLRHESLVVPPSAAMVHVARGSGVSVYRMDRSPLGAMPRSPWVIKKSNISPMLVRQELSRSTEPIKPLMQSAFTLPLLRPGRGGALSEPSSSSPAC